MALFLILLVVMAFEMTCNIPTNTSGEPPSVFSASSANQSFSSPLFPPPVLVWTTDMPTFAKTQYGR